MQAFSRKIIFSLALSAAVFIAADLNAQQISITYKTYKASSQTHGWNINISYPQVSFGPEALMGLRGIAREINDDVESMVMKTADEFRRNAEDFASNAEVPEYESTLDISCEAEVTGGTLFSSRFTNFSYFRGAAHPMTTMTAYNYSTQAYGRLDSLAMLFRKDSDYLNAISALCISKLREHATKEGYDNTEDMIMDGASAKPENYENWYVTGDSLVVIFNPYQAGPYVMGIQETGIPLSKLLALIDPKGPLEFLFR